MPCRSFVYGHRKCQKETFQKFILGIPYLQNMTEALKSLSFVYVICDWPLSDNQKLCSGEFKFVGFVNEKNRKTK